MKNSQHAAKDASFLNPGARRLMLLAGLFLIILALYAYPFLATRAQLGASPLPPLFAPDLYAYLNIGHLQTKAPHVVTNPWYGVPVPTAAVTYRKFGLSEALFDVLRRATGASWSTAVLVWTLLWTALICLAGVWFLRRLLPRGCALPVALGLGLLLLVDLRALPLLLSAWLHLPSLRGFEALALPYVRQFFPQVVIAPVLAYLTLLAGALGCRRWAPWLAMALLQMLCFALFPYAMLLLAGSTAITVALALGARRLEAGYARVAAFALLCAALDLLYLLGVGPLGVSGGGSPVGLRPALLLHLLWSKTLLLVVVVTGVVCLVRSEERPEARWTLIGMGVATALLLVADGFVSPALQIAHHGLYFVNLTLAAQLAWLLAAFYSRGLVRRPWLRWVAALLLAGLLMQGLLAARGNYRALFSFNRTQKEEAAVLLPLGLQPDDLVVAPARFVDDTCSWVPLLTRARVLFCRNAEFVLTPQDEDRVQRFRQGLYLYFTGRDAAWVEQVLSPSGDPSDQNFLSLTQQRLRLEGPERLQAQAELRALLLPRLQRAAQGDPQAAALFAGYHRVLVIDQTGQPGFVRDRLARYLRIEKEEQVGNYLLLWCRAL